MEILKNIREKIGLTTTRQRYLVESGQNLVWSFGEPEDGTKVYAIATTQMTPWDFHLSQITILDISLFRDQSQAQIVDNLSESFPQHKKDSLEITFPRGEFADEWRG